MAKNQSYTRCLSASTQCDVGCKQVSPVCWLSHFLLKLTQRSACTEVRLPFGLLLAGSFFSARSFVCFHSLGVGRERIQKQRRGEHGSAVILLRVNAEGQQNRVDCHLYYAEEHASYKVAYKPAELVSNTKRVVLVRAEVTEEIN